MRLLNPSRPESPRLPSYPVFRGPDDDFTDEVRRVGALINAWLNSWNGPRPDPRAERKLHEAIKAGPLFGKVLSFAGLNLWVDERTSDGLVMSQEAITF